MKKKVLIFGFILILSVTTFAGLEDVEKEIHGSRTSSSSSSTSSSGSGGYKQDTKIINSQYEFKYRKFLAQDFMPWYNLLIRAIAYETYLGYIDERLILRTGKALSNIDRLIYYGDTLTIEKLIDYLKYQHPIDSIYSKLIDNNIINNKGYIYKAEYFEGNFDKYDFQFLLYAVKELDLPLKDPRISEELKNELYKFIIASSKVLVINKLKTTKYQSSKNGIIENLTDNFIGNFIGGIVYPDRVQTQQAGVKWRSFLNLEEYYGIYYGFNDYPFANNNKFTMIFGKKQLSSVSYSLSDGDDLLRDNFVFRSYSGFNRTGKSVAFTNYGLNFYQLREASESLRFYSLFLGGGGAFNSTYMNFDFGLSFKQGTKSDGIGLFWGYGGEFFILEPFSISVEHTGAFQPNLEDIKNNWAYHQFQLGTNLYIGSMFLGVGYQWSTGMQGFTAGVKVYF